MPENQLYKDNIERSLNKKQINPLNKAKKIQTKIRENE